jgi:hypothetical protein
MRKLLLALLLAGSVSAAIADMSESDVRWNRIAGVITAINVDNPVGNVHAGTFPWTTRGGRARVNLETGYTAFDVYGLVINGTIFAGTPGPVTGVIGTLVCDPGDDTESVVDTPEVPLSPQGDAHFVGHLLENIPDSCTNPAFLIRISTPAGARGFWIANGTERVIGRGR